MAVLSSSTGAARDLEAIRESWQQPAPAWASLKASLEDFIASYGRDALAAPARLYLANAQLELGDVPGARRSLAEAGALPPAGSLTDLATVTQARIDRLTGRADVALTALRPLSGKLVDPLSRALLGEELTRAAVALHRDYEAVAYMDAWLRDTGEDRSEVVLARIDEALAALSPVALEGALGAMRAQPQSGYSAVLVKKMASRLARHAAQASDARLAEWLLDSSKGPTLVAGAEAQTLKDLATSLRGKLRVAGRAIGLVLPTSSPALRDASADVARGAAFALGLPRLAGHEEDGVRLLTRSEAGADTLEAALEELVGEGAAVIIAGLDDPNAERAHRWAESAGVTVIVMGRPSATADARFTYLVGDDTAESIGLLTHELATRGRSGGIVLAGSIEAPALSRLAEGGSWPVLAGNCDPPVSRARFAAQDWAKARNPAVVVAGSDACARAAAVVVRAGGVLALSPAAASGVAASPAAVTVLSFASGAFPLGGPGARIDPELQRYRATFGHAPTWWTALGHDAAAIARSAVSALPLDEAQTAVELSRRRESVRAGVGAARTDLWTTDALGFGGAHELPRAPRVVELPRAR